MRILFCALLLLAACNDKLPRDYLIDAPTGSCGGTQPPCAADEYCDYQELDCGRYSYGTCKPKPTSCPSGGPQVCTCTFGVYPSACEALKDGKLLSIGTACELPTGKLQCGYEVCDLATQYCQGSSAPHGVAKCVDAPAACAGSITCACLADQPCGNACIDRPSGPLVICP